jgi:hypothetical protein
MAHGSLTPYTMKYQIGYKELSILLGILVATLIIILIWLNPDGNEASESARGMSSHWLLPAGKVLVQQVVEIIQFYR